MSDERLFRAIGDKSVVMDRNPDVAWSCPLHAGAPGSVVQTAMLSTCRLCGFTSAQHAKYMATAALRRAAVFARRP
jgi:hypothetical protein